MPARGEFFRMADREETRQLVHKHCSELDTIGNHAFTFVVCGPGGMDGRSGDVKAFVVFQHPIARWSEGRILELSRHWRAKECRTTMRETVEYGYQIFVDSKVDADLLIGYSDDQSGDDGGFYRSMGWLYDGLGHLENIGMDIDGKFWHGRALNEEFGTRSASKLRALMPTRKITPRFSRKHRFWYPISQAGQERAVRLNLRSIV